ncbi:hypothetical protein BGZ95_001518 [Linnemannia exigua]|uniref:Uncharacterized protein n=1 Tax=Linnemannia exigua TaxID=604196 RepID=A0AAD4D8J3_9FUNG|nr:hypothetical protein BGZ95_001518 [Linnemannia exigua]
MSKSQVNKNRKIGALIAYTTLACSLVSLGVYVYRQQQQKGAGGNSSSSRRRSNNTREGSSNGASLDHDGRPSLDNNGAATGSRQDGTRSTEPQASSLSRLGSKIARTVKRNRKVMTISLKNTIVWNPSPDPTTPNYGFVEGAIPLLFHLAETYNLHLILLCPALPSTAQQHSQQQVNGKGRVTTVQEQEESKRQQQLGQERERDQILTMLGNAGLISPVGTRGPKLIDPRQLLICETEEGVSHVVRHLESQVHVDARQSVVELVQGVVPKVIFVQKKPGHSRASSVSQHPSQEQEGDIMTRSHIRTSSSRSSSSLSSFQRSEEDLGSSSVNGHNQQRQEMGDSFVEVFKAQQQQPQSEPLVSGYVTQAGKKGYVEVTDQLMRSSLNPEYIN